MENFSAPHMLIITILNFFEEATKEWSFNSRHLYNYNTETVIHIRGLNNTLS